MTTQRDTQPRSSRTSSEVTLVGRMGSTVTERELPSGDVVATFTVVVDRPRGRSAGASTATVDAIPCQVLTAGLRGKVARLAAGTPVEAVGVLRRRFWRAPQGLGSALEVQVSRIVAIGSVDDA